MVKVDAKNVPNRRLTAGLPEDFIKGRTLAKIKEGLSGTIDSVCIKAFRAMDSDGRPAVAKNGAPVFNELVYLGFKEGFIGVSKSDVILNQIAQMVIGYTLPTDEGMEVYDLIDEEHVVIGSIDAKFGDKTYPVPALMFD